MIEAITVPVTFTDTLVRLATATALGMLVGVDRERQQKPAGVRTHALVAIGAALLGLIGLHASSPLGPGDSLSRIVQGVVSGIGFVGGGVILRGRGASPADVQGLTTAASIWVVAAVGIAAGVGLWRTAAVTVAIVVALLAIGGPIGRIFNGRPAQPPAPGSDH